MRLIRIRRHVAEQQAPRPPGGHLLVAIRGFPPNIHKRGMTEEVTAAKNVPSVAVHSPGSDCNSNHTTDKNGETTGSYISNASSQDVDFIQDNTDFQWFLDYGYRDGSSATHPSLHHHASILSSLATSYACDDLSYYDDMAKNLDANLAEVDMENFRTEDIQSILTTLPAMCCGEIQSEREGEMFASVSGSMMAKFDFDSSISPHTSSQGEDSAGSTDTMSICKSELLFSPVKECPLPSTNFSVDSLDCDLLTEHDIMLTCQANKDNYTIAFEGSLTLYSEDSDYHEAGESEATTSDSNNWSSTRFAHPSGVRCSSTGGGSRPLDTSMARSDSVYTTWSKLKKRSSEVQLTRHPSGNNNTCPEVTTNFQPVDATALKSQSMPNLSRQRRRCLVSSKLSSAMSSSMESEPRTRPIKLYDVTQHHNSNSLLSAHSETNSSVDGASSCSGGGSRKQHNFSLVKLFMKQKSVSNEGMCYAMDQSSASECWPTSNNSQSEEGESDSYTHNSTVRRRPCPVIGDDRHNQVNDVNDCGCLNDCLCELHDGGDVCDNGNETKVDFSPGSVENGNNQTKALEKGTTDNWIQAEEDMVTAGTDYSTCCFEDSLVEPCRQNVQHREDSAYYTRQHELIEEEDEGREDSERSESVEQLSESVSKIEEGSSTATLDLGANSCLSSDQQQDDESRPNSSQSDAFSNKSVKPKYNGNSGIATKNISLFNVNNNNSIERDDINILMGKKWQGKGTQTKKLSNVGSTGSSPSVSGEESISTYSSSEEVTEPTKLQNLSPTQKKSIASPTAIATTRNNATQVPVHLMHRSIQTSGYADINTLKSAPFKLLESPNGTSLVKIILPSTKGLGGKGETMEEMKKPVYVFYPNYALPDLGFLKDKRKELDVAKVFLMPQKFSSPQAPPPESEKSSKAQAKVGNSGDAANVGKSRRPFSCNDMDALRKRGFAHIQDWDSLTFLLPREYRQILAEVPEVVHHLKGRNEDSMRPLFCISPPLRPGKASSQRPMSCDCGSLVSGDGKQTNVSSSSSTATQPSSGYRGSSTILSDSSTNHVPSNNYNPLFVYRYDSISSESSLMMNQKSSGATQASPAPPLPKRSISLPSGGGETKNSETYTNNNNNYPTPPRPPLPRGILRKSMENSGMTRYNCKAHKNNANSKRYSMFELGDGGDISQENKNKRRSLQDADFMNCTASPRKVNEKLVSDEKKRILCEKDVDEMEEEYDDEGVDAGTDSSLEEGHLHFEMRPPTPPLPKTPDSEAKCCGEEVLRLEDFLQLSGLSVICSGESLKEWDETDMMRLRQQVSRFLSTKQNEVRTPNNTPEHRAHPCDGCTNRKKTVSFADNVCVHIRETGMMADADRASYYTTPPNSPNASASVGGHKAYQCKLNPPLLDMPIREEAECSPDGYGSPQSEGSRAAIVTNINVAQRPVPVDLAQKRFLVTAVSDAVEQIICHFSAAENQAHCNMLGDSSHTPACAHLALSKLCPALYAVLSDGLRPMLDTAFGSIHNSVWQVVEASAQQGPMTKPLNELVLRLNGEDVLTEGLMKFNAFVFGLLNVRSLDAWVGYLRTRESILRKHYAAEGLLLLANTAGASVRALTDQLLASLQPLSLLPFKLDLLFEIRQLHLSLRRMGSLPQPDVTSPQPTSSTSPTSNKPWTLMKLVRSIQSSLSQSGDEEGHSAWYHRKQNSLETHSRTDDPAHHPNCSGTTTAESPPLPDLVDSSCNHKQWEDKPRPRSCVDNTTQHGGFSLVTDIASTVKKRWSGIQLGSKLFQAFDRLAAEDTEEEYSDSLEKQPHANSARKRQPSASSNNSNSDDSNDTNARDSSASPVPAAEGNDTRPPKLMETEDVEASCDKKSVTGSGGGKFRRLQMKWEMLSGKEANEKISPGSTSPNQSGDNVVGGGSNNASITSNKGCSKIPRLVTSPVRASGIPVLSSQQRGATKKATTPPTPTGSSQLRRANNVGTKFKINTQNISDGKLQPVPKSMGNVLTVVKRQPTAVTRCSRLDQLSCEEQGSSTRVHATRPSSLPYRPPSTIQGSKGCQGGAKMELPRRAASSSLNRQKTADASSNQRFVRTLCHRLPSDNGHLSFNEGERLRVVLEVDGKWLLCCRGDQKGLVPRTAVIALQDNSRF